MFKLLDTWGEIADDILYKSKFFSSEYFSNISQQYTTERRLTNPKTGNQLIVTANNLVYTHVIEKNYQQENKEFKQRVVDYIVPEILCRYGLIIRRLGMVFVSELDTESMKKFAFLYFQDSVKGITDFRFSRKEATPRGLLFAEEQDFINKIFSFGSIGENMQGVSYDFQLHFNPIRQDVRNIVSSFMAMAELGFSEDVLSQLRGEK
jgi:hypothetical protein